VRSSVAVLYLCENFSKHVRVVNVCVVLLGCCFLTYTTRQEADKAIEIFHNKRTLQPVKLLSCWLVCKSL